MVIQTLIEKVQKELGIIWHSETTLPDYVPGGYAGQTIPKNQLSTAVYILLTLILAGIFWNAAANTDTVSLPGGGGAGNAELDTGAMDPINGDSDEGTTETEEVDVTEINIAEVTFTLTWEDEADNNALYENEGDEFSLEVTTPWGATNETPMTRNQHGQQGSISVEFTAPGEYPDTESAGLYIANITMGDAGDQSFLGVGSGVVITDNGNSWTLTVTYSYWKESTGPVIEE